MSKYIKQFGSSTMGLFAASAIYVGILAYANFYAFDKKPVLDPGTEASLKDAGSHQPAIEIQPEAIVELSSEVVPESAQVVEAGSEIPVVDERVSQTVVATDEEASVEVAEHSLQSLAPAVVAQHIGDRAQSEFANNGQFQGDGYYNQYATANNRWYGRGYGREKGAMQGDGEFNFSMKFSSRAKMNADAVADADMNSQLHNAYYANQAMYYQN